MLLGKLLPEKTSNCLKRLNLKFHHKSPQQNMTLQKQDHRLHKKNQSHNGSTKTVIPWNQNDEKKQAEVGEFSTEEKGVHDAGIGNRTNDDQEQETEGINWRTSWEAAIDLWGKVNFEKLCYYI